jgi:hypothetical protein
MEEEKRKTKIAPSPAPDEIPSKPGSARLFLRRDCRINPEQASDEPTSTALRILGSRISNIIFLYDSLPEDKKLKISVRGIFTLPTDTDTNTLASKIKKSDISKSFFFNKNVFSNLNL